MGPQCSDVIDGKAFQYEMWLSLISWVPVVCTSAKFPLVMGWLTMLEDIAQYDVNANRCSLLNVCQRIEICPFCVFAKNVLYNSSEQKEVGGEKYVVIAAKGFAIDSYD